MGQERTFEDLLLEISALFINLPIDAIDDVIQDTQRRVCEHLQLDLSALWQWSDRAAHLMTITHLHSPEQGPEHPVGIDGSKTFPYIYGKMLSGELLAFSNDDLPEEAEVDKNTRRSFGVESSVAIPLKTGGQPVFGILSFDTLRRKHVWHDNEIKRLKLVAEIFSNALARMNSERKLVESTDRLALAAESAEAGLWELDCRTSMFWATEEACRIFGYASQDNISLIRFEKSIHPEDLVTVKQAMSESFANKEKLKVEYRITAGSGAYKWVCSRGRPYYHLDGSPSRMLGTTIDIDERKQMEEDLKKSLGEIKLLKHQVEQENFYLREDLKAEQGAKHIVGQSKEFKAVIASASQVASTTATVLLLGETGSGKGVVANAIHQMSDRKTKPFVTVNCAALPTELIESELFGREKGAFTGAHAMQVGRFEVANEGTIFLDEIGEIPLLMQAKLLRVIEDGEFERLGSPKIVKVNVRIIAATGRDLREEVKQRRFREDLFYRLNVFPITIPPLRRRTEDIPLLAQHFVKRYSHKMGKKIDSISQRTLDKMLDYHWPGNVRELEHIIERSVITNTGNSLNVKEQLLSEPSSTTVSGNVTAKDFLSNERDHLLAVLALARWKIEGHGGAASILDIHPSTLRYKLKKLGIKRPF